MDDKRYLISLIREGEHQQQDFKYRVSDACKLAKSVSAFANTDGGRLLIGVRDDGNLSGVRSEEEIYMMHQAAYNPQVIALSALSTKKVTNAPISASTMRILWPRQFTWPCGANHKNHKAAS